MIHVILSKEEIQTTVDATKLAVAFLKEQENGEHFIEPYIHLQDKMEGLQNAIDNQTRIVDEEIHEKRMLCGETDGREEEE